MFCFIQLHELLDIVSDHYCCILFCTNNKNTIDLFNTEEL